MSMVQENVVLAPYTVIKIGGPARYFVRVRSGEELEEAFQFAAQKKLALFVLGAGSNTLVSDAGFSGLVVYMKNDFIKIDGVYVNA
jgi:UDP-N-acetylmuramate dehydrogenase